MMSIKLTTTKMRNALLFAEISKLHIYKNKYYKKGITQQESQKQILTSFSERK